jgi:hypothetical protein
MNSEKNRNKRRDKKSKGKYDPKVGGLPLGFSKSEWHNKKNEKD